MNHKALAVAVASALAMLPLPAGAGDPPIPATFRFTVDNTVESLHVNGVAVELDGQSTADWTRGTTLELTLRPGTNVVAMACVDQGVIAGLLAELRVGQTALVTGSSWRYHLQPAEGWWEVDHDDQHWPSAVAYGGADEGVWAGRFSGMDDLAEGASWIWSHTNLMNWKVDPVVHFRLVFEVQAQWGAALRQTDTWIRAWEDWAVDDVKLTHGDLDEDGHHERIEDYASVGSGWRDYERCIRHGVTGHTACQESGATTYNPFWGVRSYPLEPAADNQALALFGEVQCAAPDPTAPSQGAMWQLGHPNPLEGELVLDGLVWLAGKPVAQDAVCLSVEEAQSLAGGMGWNDSGNVDEPSTWTVIYPQRAARYPLGLGQRDESRDPFVVAEAGQYQVYRHAHALALYDKNRNQHAWFLNTTSGSENAFKTDRWERLVRVEAGGKGPLIVEIARGSYSTELTVQLP